MSFLWGTPSVQDVHHTAPATHDIYGESAAAPYHPLAAPAPVTPSLFGARVAPTGLGSALGGSSAVGASQPAQPDRMGLPDWLDSISTLHDGAGYVRNASNLNIARQFTDVLGSPVAAAAEDSNMVSRFLANSPAAGVIQSQPVQRLLNADPLSGIQNNSTVQRLFGSDGPMSGAANLAGRALGAVPTALDGIGLMSGISELADPKTRNQGALDTVSSALSLAANIPGCEALEAPAFVAGMIATGNQATQQAGIWGKDALGENKDSVQWTMDNTANAWNWGRNTMAGTGSALLTDMGGAAAGLISGVGSGLVAGVTDLGAGVLKTGADAVSGVAQFGGELVTNPGAAAQDAVNFGVNAVHSVADLGNSALQTAGNIINDPGAAVNNGINIASSVASNVANGALNVGGSVVNGAVQVGQALASDVGHDLGGVGSWLGNLVTNPGVAVQDAGNFAGNLGAAGVNLATGAVSGVVDTAASVGGNLVNAGANAVGSVVSDAGNLVGGAVGGIGNFLGSLF